MQGELVRAWTDDGLQLQGLYCTSRRGTKLPAVLHIHGASSNFYRSQFLDPLAVACNGLGFSFLTANTRGHDIMNSIYTRDPSASKRIGVAFESFEECLLDIGAWLQLLEDRAEERVVLVGHSFGAHKVAFYQAETGDNRVVGLVFMSPADQGFWAQALGPQMLHILEWAKEQVANGHPRALSDAGLAPYPMSAGTIYRMFVSGKSDIFKFGRPDEPWDVISTLDCPVLATMGTVAEHIGSTPHEAMQLLAAKATASPMCETVVLNGAPHNYRGHEKEVTAAIVDWLSRIWRVQEGGPTK
jgi:pimeloyl-ACP methyl ester carboxylesterase